jgi:hypothetical protein
MHTIIADLRLINSSKAKLGRNSLLSSKAASFGSYEGITAAFEDAELAGFGVPPANFESLNLQVCRPRVNPHHLLMTPYHPIILFSHIADWNSTLYNAIAQQPTYVGYTVATIDQHVKPLLLPSSTIRPFSQ